MMSILPSIFVSAKEALAEKKAKEQVERAEEAAKQMIDLFAPTKRGNISTFIVDSLDPSSLEKKETQCLLRCEFCSSNFPMNSIGTSCPGCGASDWINVEER